jgi:uncharacterized membrane protein YcaP (DUF421 family)
VSDHDLLSLGIPVADKLLRTAVVYFGIALALRLAGKRDLAQLNSFDLVVTLLLANVVQNANGPQEVAEATLTPGGAVIVWLKPEDMAARRADVDVLRCRVDELEQRLCDKLDSLLASTDSTRGRDRP